MPVSNKTAQPTIQNVTLTLADTEYEIDLPDRTRAFSFQCRTAFAVRFAFVTGKVATPTAPYATLKSGESYNSPDPLAPSTPSATGLTDTIYLASSEAGVVVEVVSWQHP